MSDFLATLAGRSFGTLEVVQPRVPSLYEPYRRGSTLGAAGRDFPVGRGEEESAGDTESAVDVRTPAQEERAPVRTPQAVQRQTRVEAATSRVAADAGRPDDAGAPTEATGEALRGERAAARVSEGAASTPEAAVPIARRVPGERLGSPLVQVRRQAESMPEGARERSAESGVAREEKQVGRVHEGMESSEVPARRERGSLMPNRPASAMLGAAATGRAPSLPASPPAIRPPVPQRPAATGDARSSQSKVEVSIGRVEVRAVFPESRERRANAPRPRSTVSLDDYLNSRGGSGR